MKVTTLNMPAPKRARHNHAIDFDFSTLKPGGAAAVLHTEPGSRHALQTTLLQRFRRTPELKAMGLTTKIVDQGVAVWRTR